MQYAEECRTLGIPYIFDPGQQCTRMSGVELKAGLVGAHMVICNDYEFELLRQKTGFDEADVLANAEVLIITRGETGSSVYTDSGARADIPAVPPHRIVDPTGVGDAFRGGLMKGMALGLPYDVVRAHGERGRDLRARAPRRPEPLVHAGRVRRRYEEHSDFADALV